MRDKSITGDRTTVIFDGQSPDRLACDTTLRCMPDGSWMMVMLGDCNIEPLPENRVFITRSVDQGNTWSDMEPLDLGIKSETISTLRIGYLSS